MSSKVLKIFTALVLGWFPCLQANPAHLKLQDVNAVTERFFSFHVENREWNPTLVRRFLKVYIEQFDPERLYLLESEVSNYLNLSDEKEQSIRKRLAVRDYSDLAAIQLLFQEATVRFQKNRTSLAKALNTGEIDAEFYSGPNGGYSRYSTWAGELVERQKSSMLRFFFYHKARTRIDTLDKQAKVFALFDKKLRRLESNTLYFETNGQLMDSTRVEHLKSIRLLKAFAKSLDTHTAFFSPEEAQEMRLSLEKQFEGVGIVLSEGIEGYMIAELIDGSPAQASGEIRSGDFLVEIDGQSIDGLAFQEVLGLLKKKDRGAMSLGFKRIDAETGQEQLFHVQLSKRPITMRGERIQSSFQRYENGIIGRIALHSFYESSNGDSSEKDLKEAIRAFRQEGELRGLVLDLRENSGGFLSQAVKVAGLFLSNGVVVISKYGRGELHYLRNIVTKTYYTGPLIVLTSRMSASASEIVAQTLQDYGVALVVGDERTFGKGSIQYQTLTDEKADYFFKITVGRYYTASGKSPQIEGVVADIIVPSKYAPYKIGERYLEYPLPADTASPAYVDPLTDLDPKTRVLFEQRYSPYQQRVVTYWKKMLPTLAKNSTKRLAKNPEYLSFLKKQQIYHDHFAELPVNTIDDQLQSGLDVIQEQEAFEILKDMLIIEAHASQSQAALLPTGT